MLDSKINQNYNTSTSNPTFRAGENASKPDFDREKQEKSSTAKWVIGAGLTALAASGIYIATRGKTRVKINPKEISPPPVAQKNPAQLIENYVEEAKKLTEEAIIIKENRIADIRTKLGKISEKLAIAKNESPETVKSLLQEKRKLVKALNKVKRTNTEYIFDQDLGELVKNTYERSKNFKQTVRKSYICRNNKLINTAEGYGTGKQFTANKYAFECNSAEQPTKLLVNCDLDFFGKKVQKIGKNRKYQTVYSSKVFPNHKFDEKTNNWVSEGLHSKEVFKLDNGTSLTKSRLVKKEGDKFVLCETLVQRDNKGNIIKEESFPAWKKSKKEIAENFGLKEFPNYTQEIEMLEKAANLC